MAIIGIERLVYVVDDLTTSARFFEDFGLMPTAASAAEISFQTAEGSSVTLLSEAAATALSQTSVAGQGVKKVVWGVDSTASLGRLATDLGKDHEIEEDAEGVISFATKFGVAMGFKVWAKKPVLCVPQPGNAPGHVVRLNQHRRWRRRTYAKTINHVVFAIPDYECHSAFLRERLGFRLSDEQVGFGHYLRADGSNNHHTILLLNANAPLPHMDGQTRFHHANFGVEDIDEIMTGVNYMVRRGWAPSHSGLGRHRIDSALFYYMPCPAGGEAEYGADSDYIDDAWVPRRWPEPLFAYAHYVHDLPPFLEAEPRWAIEYLTDDVAQTTPTEGNP